MARFTKADLLKLLEQYDDTHHIKFSVAIDEKEDPEERWFCDDGIEDCFLSGHKEVTICLVGESNYRR